MTPTSGGFRGITGAAVAYGLTTGAAQAPEIGITPLGTRIVRPTTEGDDLAAKREALLRPKVVGEFLRDYDGASLPSDEIAKNVLLEKGVPHNRVDHVLELIVEGARSVGLIREWSGKQFVDLAPVDVDNHDAENANGGGDGKAGGESGDAGNGKAASPAARRVTIGAGVNVNIEIHIAADASAETIEDIFRNMRRYVLNVDQRVDE
jgi:hypothetical protein